ncbi:hypothetical protein IGI04_028469 [Brassica rapa subsp. trilocularis]|uniref:Uncharacterized protein n=1 Tax=Brassica rapa subsp. trilocularis TaxID=1813537 RepID=A0ABQ7L200_BRACM|nr:hypothetical protein IGI04_028469 [Brassica rapa subsp. trilocularis]
MESIDAFGHSRHPMLKGKEIKAQEDLYASKGRGRNVRVHNRKKEITEHPLGENLFNHDLDDAYFYQYLLVGVKQRNVSKSFESRSSSLNIFALHQLDERRASLLSYISFLLMSNINFYKIWSAASDAKASDSSLYFEVICRSLNASITMLSEPPKDKAA